MWYKGDYNNNNNFFIRLSKILRSINIFLNDLFIYQNYDDSCILLFNKLVFTRNKKNMTTIN